MTGFINPNSIKLNGSSDHKEVIYSHLVSRWSNRGNTGHTFSLMKLEVLGDLWRSIKPQMKYVNMEIDVLAALIIIEENCRCECVCVCCGGGLRFSDIESKRLLLFEDCLHRKSHVHIS